MKSTLKDMRFIYERVKKLEKINSELIDIAKTYINQMDCNKQRDSLYYDAKKALERNYDI